MPATEQTWRNQRTLHVVFGATALVMALATIWMMVADHNREWKDWQLKDRRKDAWMTDSRRDALAEQYDSRMRQFEAEIREYDSQAMPPGVVVDFKRRVLDQDAELQRQQTDAGEEPAGQSDAEVTPVSFQAEAVANPNDEQFNELDDAIEQLSADAKAAAEAQSAVDEATADVERVKSELAKLNAVPADTEEEGPPPAADAEQREAQAAQLQEQIAEQEEALKGAQKAQRDAQDAAIESRRDALAEFNDFIREARRRETALVARKKSLNGVRTAKVSELGIKIGQGADEQSVDAVQNDIDNLDRELTQLTADIAAAKGYRTDLEAAVARAEAPKATATKELDEMKTELAQLDEQVYENTSNVGEWVTRWPVLNALYSGNIRIEQNWLPDMTINYNFSQVARFDRCTTCHRSIAKTAPGSATEPLYPTIPKQQRDLTVQLMTPETPPEGGELKGAYGMELSEAGIITDGDVTVHYVLPESPAAKAGVQSGDVLREIAGNPVYTPEEAADRLTKLVPFGSAVEVSLRRGLDHPFTAHPRLDLYLTDSSPHPMKDVGCTICHDGQGSGTSFPWTSHTPDNAHQQNRWASDLDWFDNHHWIFPMKPARFTESNCLKCHHEKGSLAPSERFPEPPAPKLVEGWALVEEYGCFGCHEINGYDAPEVTVGPDVRLEPLYYEAASQMLRSDALTDEQRAQAHAVRNEPENDDARRQLLASFNQKTGEAEDAREVAEATAEPENADQAKTDARDSADLQKLASLLKDVEIPGEYRKVGPSLRFLSSKVDYDWVYSWIRKPSDFRPSTKMPQFFLQYEHLSEDEDAAELAESQRFEPIEIRALAEYLLDASDKFEYEPYAEGVTEEASAERGKVVFETRGCLACHSHADFPGVTANQGPDLSRLNSKLTTDKGRQWLYSWVKQPNRYHVRTVMPDTFLDPIVETDAQNQPTGVVTDPAADVVAYLLGVESDWQPENVPPREQWSEADREALADLAELWLTSDDIPASRARKYLEGTGFDESQWEKLKADERILVGLNDENRVDRQLEFVARRTIGKYGCFGCHDIPGFEDAKPIGTALVDWGRKETSKLAFENIHKFLETHGLNPENPTHEAHSAAANDQQVIAEHGSEGQPGLRHEDPAEHAAGGHAGHLIPADFSEKDSYFVQSLNSHGRDGFLWQKLRYPRSYDYKTTRNKNFNERLRMPKFPFSDEQREAVMTFILGLVKEPPATKYLHKPTELQQAIVDGRQVLERFNCAGCHTLKQEQWEFDHAGDTFEDASEVIDYPFLAPQFTDQEIAESLAEDYRGMQHASVTGHPMLDEETGEVTWVDQDRTPITREELLEAEAEEGAEIPVFFRFMLWENALVNGQPRLRGIDELLIPADREQYGPANGRAYPAWGGDLARYLFPRVIEQAKKTNPQVIGREAWGWLPPPLTDEGKKVQTDWLHGFLMDPYAIRPATVMRMPNFHMSSDEAAKLVDYFAASSGAKFPYEYKPQQRSNYLDQLHQQRENPLGEAMNIVTNGNYCVKCHAVADFSPQGDRNTFGPNLAEVYRRLRPEFTRDWVANPARILPYTGMPVNLPYRPDDPHLGGVAQELYDGTSIEQLTGLVDLLLNFDAYARGNTSVTPLVQQAAQAAAAQQGQGQEPNSADAPGASAAEGTGESTQ